jgi:hypothetical protein
MTIRLQQPVETFRVTTPAADFLADMNRLILGVTLPKYEGTVIHDDLPVRMPVFISEPGPADTQVQVRYMSRVTHDFSWEISLPPNPVHTRWITNAVPWANINNIIRNLPGPAHGVGVAAPAPTARLELVPHPNPAALFAHIRNHEWQHAAEHRWLVQKIFKPWDDWVLSKHGVANPFRAKPSSFEWIGCGGTHGAAPEYFMRYYKAATDDIGDSFHATTAGARPVITYLGNANDAFGSIAQFRIEQPALIHAKPDFMTAAPHRWFSFMSIRNYASGASVHPLGWAAQEEGLPPVDVTQHDIDVHEQPVVEHDFSDFMASF